MKYKVTRFKSLKVALKELERFIRDGAHLQTGKAFEQLGGLRSREALANWLLCVSVNSVTQPDRLTFSSDPVDGDGIICDTLTEETWQTEHVMVPNLPANEGKDTESLILEKIALKWEKGEAYGSGRTLVVFLNAGGSGRWVPDQLARRLPSPLHFEAVWVVGLQAVEAGEYIYNVTRLDLSQGHAPAWRVRIGKEFDDWRVEPIKPMSTNPLRDLIQVESLSNAARVIFLARVAHLLTVSARGTYEVGTENILKPQLLRAYNELLHRVTGAIRDHLLESKHCTPLEAVLDGMLALGTSHNAEAEMLWVVRQAASMPFPTEH
jgi:hypothetical protein